MRWQAFLIGALVLVMRLVTLPRTPWDAEELRFPFVPMVALTVTASVVTAVALAMAFGSVASLLFSFSAAVLVHGGTARLEVVAWMFLALALLWLRKPPWLAGALAGAAVACHPPLMISALVLVLTQKDRRWIALLAFAIVGLPFVAVPETLPLVHEFNLLRFTVHPWGSKLVALPVLVCAAFGVRSLRREWKPELDVLLWFTVVHAATGIAFVNPADGVRWAVPSLIFVAVLTARARWIAASVIAALSVWYAYPVLHDRATRPSPPIEAARAIPGKMVVLHDREMAPFAGGIPLDQGLRAHLDDEVPLLFFGGARLQGARVFSRPDRDAYGKLTPNAYRNVSLLPIEHRYAPLRGVHGLEHNASGESWRWLDKEAEIGLPRDAHVVLLTLRSPSGPNEVWINETRVALDAPVEIPATRVLRIRAARAFALQPPDTRQVAVQLVNLEYR